MPSGDPKHQTPVILHWFNITYFLTNRAEIYRRLTWNFFINRRLTFSFSRKGSPLRQYPRYVASCGVGAAVSWAVAVGLGAWVDFFARHLLTAAVAGILAGTVCNFTLSRYWVFQAGAPE